MNTQFFWCARGPPVGFWASVPIVCRVVVDKLPVGTESFFDVSAVREQYAWSVVASECARDCIARLDAGEDSRSVQYGIVRDRAAALPWAYGGTPAVLSQYGKVGQSAPPVERGTVKARVRHIVGGGKKASSSSSDVGPAGRPPVIGDQRRKSDGDKVEALWRRAFDPDTLVPLQQYATSSTFEDPGDRRKSAEKYNWWGMYLAERRAQGLYVPDVFIARSDRYLETMTKSATRRTQKDRRREARVAAKEAPVVDLVSECSDREEDGGSVASGVGSKRKRRDSRSEDTRSKPRGAKARKVEADTDSDDEVPRFLRPDRVGRPLADYAPGYDMVAHKIQKDAMRAIGTVWGPEGRLQCLGSAALFSKEDRTMGTDYEVDGTRAGEHIVASPRTKALQVEEVLVGLRDTLSEGINRLRWLIDFGYNSPIVPNGRREKPKGKR